MNWVVSSVEDRIDQALAVGALHEALQMATTAGQEQPGSWALQYRHGLVLVRLNKPHDAFARFTQALKLNPLSAEVRIALANAYLAMDDGWTAAAWVSDACRVQPHSPQQWLQLAQLLSTQKRESELEPALRCGLAANPQDPGLLEGLAEFLLHTKRFVEAEQAFAQLEAVLPTAQVTASMALHHGFSLEHTHQLEPAIAKYRQSLALSPDLLEAVIDLAGILWRTGDYAGSFEMAHKAAQLAPDHPHAVRILGTAYLHLNRLDEAEVHLRRALALQDPFPIATVDLALLLLLAGRFEEGWTVYERRWTDTGRMVRPAFFQSDLEWKGPQLQPVAGKRVIIYAEQGLGDVIQFIRYAAVLQADGATVFCVVQPDLIELVESMPGVVCLKPHLNIQADYHVALLELPLHYRTHAGNVPNAVPYLKVSGDKKSAWALKLKPWAGQFKLGITWAGHHIHANHHNRSMPLSAFLPILQMAGVQVFSLQKTDGQRYDDVAFEEDQLVDFTADLHDFTDTAALVDNLDLVIAIDSSVAHLAGALGKPTWVPLPPNPDWRWLLEREDSPWYPSMRLFRRTHDEPKPTQMDRVAQALQVHLQSKNSSYG